MKRILLLTTLVLVIIIFSGCASEDQQKPGVYNNETETTFYEGQGLTPIAEQRNNAIKGTQYIERESYRLQVDGLVENPREFSYEEITALPRTSKIVDLDCVEGWGFTGKWTGVKIADLFEEVGVMESASTVIFYSADGYSTALELDYLLDNNIILAYKLNDVALPPDRGFPLQLVAESKYGYKWAKWIVRIELSDSEYRGYWEKRGYNDRADVGGPAFER